MSNIPKNTKLWDMCIMQAKAKFDKWPSPVASAWVRKKYTQMGGQFVDSTLEMSPSERRDKEKDDEDRKNDVSRNDRSTKRPVASSF